MARVYCAQTAGWIKRPLGMEVGPDPSDTVLHADSAPLAKKGAEPPIFGPCMLWPNAWMDKDATWNDGRPRPRQHCVRCGPSSTPRGTISPPKFRPISVVAKWLDDQDATWYEGRPRPRPWPHCVTWKHSSPSQKGHSPHFLPMSIVAKRSAVSVILLSTCYKRWPH